MIIKNIYIGFFSFLLLLSCTKDDTGNNTAIPGQWTYHRGDNKNSGFTKGKPPANGYFTYLWSFDDANFINRLVSSHNKVFVTRDSLRIIDLDTRKVVFRDPSIFGCQPTLSGNNMYVGNEEGDLFKFDFVSNKLVWKVKLDHIPCSTPVIEGRNVLLIASDRLYCLSTETGETIWNIRVGSTKYGSVAVADGVCCIGNEDGEVFALSVSTGEIMWKRSGFNSLQSLPVLAGDRLFIGAKQGVLYCLNISDGQILWKYQAHEKLTFSIGATDGKNVVFNAKSESVNIPDSIFCMNVKDGTNRWQHRSYDSYHRTVLIVNNKVLCHVNGKFSMVDINSGIRMWEYFYSIHDTPILIGNRMVINLGKGFSVVGI